MLFKSENGKVTHSQQVYKTPRIRFNKRVQCYLGKNINEIISKIKTKKIGHVLSSGFLMKYHIIKIYFF